MSDCPILSDTKLDHLVRRFTVYLNPEFLVVFSGKVCQNILSDTVRWSPLHASFLKFEGSVRIPLVLRGKIQFMLAYIT